MDIVDYSEDQRPVNMDTSILNVYGTMEDKPETEQLLFKLQDEYYGATDDNTKLQKWTEMFQIVKDYARSTVLKKLKSKKFLEPDIVESHANQAAVNFMSQYLYRKNFKCGASFNGVLNYKVIETVYGKKEDDQTLSLQIENQYGDEFDITSAQRKSVGLLWGREYDDVEESLENSYTLIDYINELIDDFDSNQFVKKSPILQLKMRMYLLLIIKKPKNRHIKEQFIKYNCKSKKEIDAFNLVELELQNRFDKTCYI